MPALHRISLLVETDDTALVETLVDGIEHLACPGPIDEPNHVCDLPWFIIESTIPDDERAEWDDLLNR